mmetsp:Transcript_27027/g.81533  ORF Transcript_27027/g.81533 Transcript_27027/m.81533 type:complete len:228 (+) Transcript_27027:702-1385(+)
MHRFASGLGRSARYRPGRRGEHLAGAGRRAAGAVRRQRRAAPNVPAVRLGSVAAPTHAAIRVQQAGVLGLVEARGRQAGQDPGVPAAAESELADGADGVVHVADGCPEAAGRAGDVRQSRQAQEGVPVAFGHAGGAVAGPAHARARPVEDARPRVRRRRPRPVQGHQRPLAHDGADEGLDEMCVIEDPLLVGLRLGCVEGVPVAPRVEFGWFHAPMVNGRPCQALPV